MKNKARMSGEESQIESRTGTESVSAAEVTHELVRAVSGVPNPAVEPTLEKAEGAEKRA